MDKQFICLQVTILPLLGRLLTQIAVMGCSSRGGSLCIAWGGGVGEDLRLNKVKFSRSPLECYFTEVILPNNIWWLSRSPPPMSSFSKKIWVVPLWILPMFSAIPPFGFSVATDPPFCSPKNQVIPSNILRSPPPPAINNDRSPSVGDQGEIFYLLHWWHSFYYTYLHLSQMG